MLITCKACAAVNFIQVNRAKPHCTICRKLLDLSAVSDADEADAFRIQRSVPKLGEEVVDDHRSALVLDTKIGNMLAESVARAPAAEMWGNDDDDDTSDPRRRSELEQKIKDMNSKQRLAIATLIQADDEYVTIDSIEDEEEELIDPSSKFKLPAIDMARWNKTTVSSIPANKRRQRLNQRLTLAAWIFVAGLGTAGAAGAAVAHTTATATTTTPTSKTATAALAEIAPQQATARSAKNPR